MKSDNVSHFILNSLGCLSFKLMVYIRILCVYLHIQVCVYMQGVERDKQRGKRKELADFEGRDEFVSL